MAKAGLRLFGDERLERQLQELPKRLRNKILRQSLRAQAKRVRDAAVTNIPRKEGEFRKKIRLKVRAGKRSRKGVSMLVLVVEAPGQDNFAGAAVELGTSDTAPQPYLRPAMESNRLAVLHALTNDIRSRLPAEAKSVK